MRVKDSNGTIIKQICGYLEQDLVVYSTNNSMSIQFYTDSAVDGAGFLASYESIDENIDTEDLFDENNKQGYVLSFPQAFTVNAETKQDQLCLQMLNLENDGKIKLSIYAAKNLISGERLLKIADFYIGLFNFMVLKHAIKLHGRHVIFKNLMIL